MAEGHESFTGFLEIFAPIFQRLTSLIGPPFRQPYRILEAKKLESTIPESGRHRRGRQLGPWPSSYPAAAVTCVVGHESEVCRKPCQTAGPPDQVSPSDEVSRVAAWRRSPDLPWGYFYRHRVSAAPASGKPKATNPFSPNSRGIIDCKAGATARGPCQPGKTKQARFRLTPMESSPW